VRAPRTPVPDGVAVTVREAAALVEKLPVAAGGRQPRQCGTCGCGVEARTRRCGGDRQACSAEHRLRTVSRCSVRDGEGGVTERCARTSSRWGGGQRETGIGERSPQTSRCWCRRDR
jgi:hypothetical protein